MLKNLDVWLPGYLKKRLQAPRRVAVSKPIHIMFCIADHFEPRLGGVSLEKEMDRVDRFMHMYSRTAERHADSEGSVPKCTFFYPIDEYTPLVFEKIVEFCGKGFGEVEVHLHHDNDTEGSLRKKLEHAKDVFGKSRYGFVHGNWALGNSRKDGRWCGVNNELGVLRDTGCYADFTLPSAPSETQTRKSNSIYYAWDTGGAKPHNTGVDVEAGKAPAGGLMIVQGPLALNWRRRKYGVIPRIENSELTFNNPPTADRVDLWIDQRISVKGRPDWVFIKVHAHGMREDNLADEYFMSLNRMFRYLEDSYNDGLDHALHYVTAREMYNIIKAAEAGRCGSPGTHRDYSICPGLKRGEATKNGHI